jgi:putative DNA primase/helicase
LNTKTQPERDRLREKLQHAKARENGDVSAAVNDPQTNATPAQGEIWLSRRFAERCADRFRYVPEWGKWIAWDGTRWRVDAAGAVRLTAKDLCDETATAMRLDLANGNDASSRARVARYYESARMVAAVVQLANCEPAMVCRADQLDRDDFLFNTPAGTVDLRTGAMRAHRREDFITKSAGAAPNDGPSPVFDQFLSDVTCGDTALADYLQIALGAILSGAVSDHWLMFWYGHGRNGKNTLGDLVAGLLGDYAKAVPAQTLMADAHGNRHPTEVANLRGLRLAVSSEIGEGESWNEARLKEMTGDATLSARFMRGDFFEFRRTHKHLVFGNHRPLLRVVDRGIVARLHIVPFRATFSVGAGNLDPDMPAKLRAEAGAVLRWMIDGHMKWMQAGTLRRCPAVSQATDDYFAGQSTIDRWIAERCIVTEDDGRGGRAWPKAGDLYASFSAWRKDRGEFPLSATRWGDQMTTRFKQIRADGMRYVGVQLLASGGPS